MAKATTPKIKGDTPVSKAALERAAQPKRGATPQDETPEAQPTPAKKSAAADRMFKNADEAAAAGLPADLTRDQHETMQRRAVLGY